MKHRQEMIVETCVRSLRTIKQRVCCFKSKLKITHCLIRLYFPSKFQLSVVWRSYLKRQVAAIHCTHTEEFHENWIYCKWQIVLQALKWDPTCKCTTRQSVMIIFTMFTWFTVQNCDCMPTVHQLINMPQLYIMNNLKDEVWISYVAQLVSYWGLETAKYQGTNNHELKGQQDVPHTKKSEFFTSMFT